jgi:hypothetical protein
MMNIEKGNSSRCNSDWSMNEKIYRFLIGSLFALKFPTNLVEFLNFSVPISL